MQGGVVQYLVKPFLFDTLRDRLERYALLKDRLKRVHEANQEEVDHLFSLLRAQGQARLPKGISAPTLGLVISAVRNSGTELSAIEVADQAGVSRGTARRYLEYLALVGSLELSLRYGAAGRPEHLYRWVGAVGAFKE
jgi:two-component system CitB family response regulator